MLVAPGSLSSAQSKGTQATMDPTVQPLNCAATHPDAVARFHKSNMILHIHSDASCLSETKARSRIGGFHFLDGKDEPNATPKTNGAVHAESRILRPVMASTAEAETAGLFHNAQEGAATRNTLAKMGHPQPGPTPMQCDNTVVMRELPAASVLTV